MASGKQSVLKTKVSKDLNKIAAIEKAIAKKFGTETVLNPKSLWDDEKEEEYLEQLKEYSKKQQIIKEESERVEKDGFFLPKNLINKTSKRKCPICKTYSFDKRDDLYMNKFEFHLQVFLLSDYS